MRTPEELTEALLYQTRLVAPLDSLGLIFSANQLPAGPGSRVLGWITLILALVFSAGFYTLYRTGLAQIRLTRQQQDFVSAVSHELKTPLTLLQLARLTRSDPQMDMRPVTVGEVMDLMRSKIINTQVISNLRAPDHSCSQYGNNDMILS